MGLLNFDIPTGARSSRRMFGVKGRFYVCKSSRLIIGENSKGNGVKFKLINSVVNIGRHCDLGSLKITAVDCEINIGNNTRFVGYSDITSPDGCNIIIGNNCLFANGCWITASDHHAIENLDNGERLNYSRPITIEDGVWLAREVIVLKGSTIRVGSAIGIRSVVTREIPEHSIAVGIPAKAIKSGIRWS